MITTDAYFGPRRLSAEITQELRDSANALLHLVNTLLLYCADHAGYKFPIDPDTGTCVSGSKGNSGDGGWRSSTAKTGGPGSKHRTAQAVDVYDPGNVLDTFITDELLAQFKLWREHPSATPGWCHLQSVPPKSGRRSYYP